MASLTVTAYYSRKYIKLGAIAVVAFIILRIVFGMFFDYLRAKFPPNFFKPNHLYGVLPKIDFPQTASPSGEITFTLQTVTGTLPQSSEAARIFFMPKGRSNLLSLSRAQSMVGKIGFTTTPRQLSDTLYRWVDIRSPLRTVEMDIISNHFTLNYLYQHDLSLFTEKNLPQPAEAAKECVAFMQNLGARLTDINTFQPQVTYLKLVGNALEPAVSQAQADAVKVDFFRLNYDGMRIVNDTLDEGNITFILSGSTRSDRRILYAKYRLWSLDQSSQGIYQLKKSDKAWLEFLAGKAYFVSFPQNQTKIPITDIYLAYFDSANPQLFMQPVFVFAGEDNFAAYVPAVDLPWTQ